jgi:hypothetical protein
VSDLRPPITDPDIDLRASYDAATHGAAQPDDAPSLGELMGNLSRDVGDLLSTQVKLAVEEMKEEAKTAAKGAGFMGGSGVLGNLALTLLTFALAFGLADLFDSTWLGFFVVSVLVGAAAAALFLMGRRTLGETNPVPRQTVETIQEDKQWLRQQMS